MQWALAFLRFTGWATLRPYSTSFNQNRRRLSSFWLYHTYKPTRSAGISYRFLTNDTNSYPSAVRLRCEILRLPPKFMYLQYLTGSPVVDRLVAAQHDGHLRALHNRNRARNTFPEASVPTDASHGRCEHSTMQ
ncbi:hypothetical protein BDW22DRAFT_1049714 [Trametopsis cervina]|nr:hypothetical protein BDW22DRAFT_1049714 [Trametopsis cervina]